MIPSICKNWLKISPILGFLAAGTLLGPNMLNVIGDTHTVEVLGELGIVFFLFEMGVELSTERLLSMKKDVFGLGLSQFSLTTIVGMLIGSGVFHGKIIFCSCIVIIEKLLIYATLFICLQFLYR